MKNNFVLYILVIISLVLSLFNSALLIKNVIPSNTTNTAATSNSSVSYDDMVGTWYLNSSSSNFIVVEDDGTVHYFWMGSNGSDYSFSYVRKGYFSNGNFVITELGDLQDSHSFDGIQYKPYADSYELTIIDENAFRLQYYEDDIPETFIRLSDVPTLDISELAELID